MIAGLGPFELLIILAIVIAIFGAGKLAGIGGALGGSIREFRRSVRDDEPARPTLRDDEPRDTTRV
ncbi:MAG: twin-arginine translocase TatA/TatE family subunit [Chloroflexota bacterium]|nr:twin-arginine translocase TatA/TatE family subunit [Chloroflexota bacterium]PLS83407.1 MAG: twin-arginine translocase TatA/TatE family subunit [Chloroflexota bacterium]